MKGFLVICIVVADLLCVNACWNECSKCDCVWGDWQAWTPCSITCGSDGTQTRTRNVVTYPSCGGTACSDDLSQNQRTCSPGCTRGTPSTGYCTDCPFPYTGSCCEQLIEDDPCTTHIELDQTWRSTNYQTDADKLYCYTDIINYWHRFTGESGGDMPTTCVTIISCGVYYPIWLSGGHPGSDEGVVNRKVCISESTDGDENCCTRTHTIKVKNCGDSYYVYKLYKPQNCDEGFCAGEESPCPPGTSSQNGYTPNCLYPSPFNSYIPTLEFTATDVGDSEFVCTFNVQHSNNISYIVTWYADEMELHNTAVSNVQGTSVALDVGQLGNILANNNRRISAPMITCGLAAQYIYSDGTAKSEPSVPNTSNSITV